MAREININVNVRSNEATRKLRGLESSIGGVAGGAVRAGGAMSGLLRVAGGIGVAAIAWRGFKSSVVDLNASLETSTLQFETLMGSAARAEQHVRDLFEFGARTPFETGPIIEASRLLQTFGGDALNTMENLTLIGDAAAATSAPIEALGMWVGRLHAQLQAGRPFGEAAQRLTELAVLTPQARTAMEDLAKSGGTATEVFALFEQELQRFTGSMERQAQTWEGVTSTFLENLGLLAADKGSGVFDAMKAAIQSMNTAMEGATASAEALAQSALPRLVARQEALVDIMRRREAAGAAISEQDRRQLGRLNDQIAGIRAAGAQTEIRRQAEEAFGRAVRMREEAETSARLETDRMAEAAAKAAAEAAKMAEEQARVDQAFRDSVVSFGALTFGYTELGKETRTLLGVQPALIQNIEGIRHVSQGLTQEGLIPTTEAFVLMNAELPTVEQNLINVGFGAEVMQGTFSRMKDSLVGNLVNLKDQFLSFDNVVSGIMQGAFGPGGFIANLAQQGIQKLVGLFGTGLKKIGGFFKKVFGGPSAEELAGREIVENFQANMQSILTDTQRIEAGTEPWKAANIAVRDSYLEVGLSEQQAMADVQALYDAIKSGPEATQGALDVIMGRMESLRESAQGAASAFGDLIGQAKAAGDQAGAISLARQAAGLTPFATGGIAMGPTAALIGEREPEAVIPLSQLGNVAPVIRLDLRGSVVSSDQAMQRLTDQVSRGITNALRRERRVAV